MLIYAELEDAVIARIEAAREGGALGYHVPFIGSYGGEFDADTFWESFRQFPAVWVAVGGESGRQVGARDRQCTVKLAVMVGARSPRGERWARRGLAGAVGTYQLLQDVRDLLGGRTLGLGISPLRVGATRTLYNTKIGADGLSVLAQELEADYTWTVPHDESAAPDLTSIALRYRLTPGDDTDDAVDVVNRPD